jgi:AAA15 family ATPase/GTPase
MNNNLNQLEIKNFKSIKQLSIDCKRVNVFIGKPNVGKSNILEAISLFGACYSVNQEKYLSELIRYQEVSNLFYDDDLLNIVSVNSDKTSAKLRYDSGSNRNMYDLTVGDKDFIKVIETDESIFSRDHKYHDYMTNYNPKTNAPYLVPLYQSMEVQGIMGRNHSSNYYPAIAKFESPVRKYQFKNANLGNNKFPNYLLPTSGDNLFTIVDHNKNLRQEIVEIFKQYKLNFVGYKKENTFEIEKNIDGYITKYHYNSIADTFQRLIFYFAAIDSNKDAVLVLEEPEVHSFPPYTRDLAQRIVESTENQFFITTHSPYLLQNLMENLGEDELNVLVTYYEDYQTKVRKLTNEELTQAADFGIDLFYNLDSFVKHG